MNDDEKLKISLFVCSQHYHNDLYKPGSHGLPSKRLSNMLSRFGTRAGICTRTANNEREIFLRACHAVSDELRKRSYSHGGI